MPRLTYFLPVLITVGVFIGITGGQTYGQSCSTTCPARFARLNASDCFMLLIDYQTGVMLFVRNVPRSQVLGNMKYLAHLAKALNIPTVMTTSLEDEFDGPIVDELQQILPDTFASRIPRHGTINAWDEPAFRAAVLKAAGERKTAILAGLTNDVCVVNPAISMVQEGFNVIVVQDASGSPNAQADENARRRWEKGGARTYTTGALQSEIANDWSSPVGSKVLQMIIDQYLPTFNTTYPWKTSFN
ncbi:probable hydrolase YcaC [Paramacrobiotus metropolitanus]|uniref:probable hydrolase YcaC n=1 Tax=Paramacrobiotus metropolitanus TaxID=2943436 RepID=UPI0024456452|nr:probable hydrolase YcaC [Paramacrobiotus metropolitanus]XP_055335828.1 probable hydrolase YcaC [Paramacrobiotus metropolitanus]XP_055335829.1 probable hydrolase YcaC [Paramacrobiotus metropolitanus]